MSALSGAKTHVIFALQTSEEMLGQKWYLVFHKMALLNRSPCLCSHNGVTPARHLLHHLDSFAYYEAPCLTSNAQHVSLGCFESGKLVSQEMQLHSCIAFITASGM